MQDKIIELAGKYPVVSVIGPRQSGKTTLVRATFPEKRYVSLEDPDTREFAQTDPRGFLSTYTASVIFDEVQRVPHLFSYIQTIVDQKQKSGQYILTGSSNYLLQENLSQTLAGRVAILKLLPLSIEELIDAGYPVNNYEEYIFKGLYPRIYDHQLDPEMWYAGYIQTYIERDVRLIKNITDLSAFQRFIKLCAGRIGQLLNLSALGSDCGISHNTAKSWLSILESSFIIFLLQPHFNNFNKRLVKQPKLYFYDPGLAASLLGIESEDQLDTHYLKGGLFETFIISELAKFRFNRSFEPQIYFWRDNKGSEIDCIIEHKNKLIPVEIKAGKTIGSDYFKMLNYWSALAAGKAGPSFLIYGGNESQSRSQGQVIGWQDAVKVYY
ncbi:MAG: ATP-binding protein [Bacillota bacterium]|nr:ATP-binding protein [Bacillota bacterium]